MVCAIVIIVTAVIAAFVIKSYAKRIATGCCGSGGDTIKKIEPVNADKSSYSYLYKIKIEGMHCRKCALKIQNAFNEREGLLAEVDLNEDTAYIYSNKILPEFEIRRTVVGMDYKVTDIEKVNVLSSESN